jgi:hypothetical protein
VNRGGVRPDNAVRVHHPLGQLAQMAEEKNELLVRIHRVDGMVIESYVIAVSDSELYVYDKTAQKYLSVPTREVESVEVNKPRRAREWTLALFGLPVITAFLVAFSRLPGVRPEMGHMTIGFILFAAIVWGITSMPRPRRLLNAWFTMWLRVYP